MKRMSSLVEMCCIYKELEAIVKMQVGLDR